MAPGWNRRAALKGLLSSAATVGLLGGAGAHPVPAAFAPAGTDLAGRLRQSVCRWCFQDMPLEQLCAAAKEMGLRGIDLVEPADWPTLRKYGLDSPMCNGAEINLTDGFNDPRFHARLQQQYAAMIPRVAATGYTNLICFSGSRRGLSDEAGWVNCARGLQPLLDLAARHKVVLVMELLNAKVDHPDYQCNRTRWGVTLAQRLGSEHFKLLYDIYHMQIDEGDVIRTITDYHPYIAHYHTAGVPGRHEPDDTQELNYPAIMRAIRATGFQGYVAQEFVPARADKLASLRQAVRLCDV